MGLVPDEILRKDSVGVRIDITVIERGIAANISDATQKNYIITKPSGVRVTKTAIFITDGTDGQLRYVTIAGDLDELGQYKIQIDLIVPSGYDGPTEIGSFWVEDNL